MLTFARQQVGKPFSNSGMARSVIFPRQSTLQTYFCAELVAAILRHGGLMYAAAHHPRLHSQALASALVTVVCPIRAFCLTRSVDSNPGAATPYSLYKLYSKQAAATANPYTLRQVGSMKFSLATSANSAQSSGAPCFPVVPHSAVSPELLRALPVTGGSARRRTDSPPRASFRLVTSPSPVDRKAQGLTLSLTSLR